MHALTTTEIGLAVLILLLADAVIVAMIAAGLKISSDAKVEEAEKSVERRAERLAKQIVKERFCDARLQVTQRIVVIEDDLKKEA